jgi:hypothetical protein
MQQNLNNRIQRTELELAKALRDQLVILRDALGKLLSDFAYIKIISAVIRVLVYSKGRNKPLLLSLGDMKNDNLLLTTDGPPMLRKTIPLRNFMQEMHFISGTENIEMTIEEFIGFSSQQEGVAHEDSAIDRNYVFSKGDGMLIGGVPPHIYAIRGYGNTIYAKGIEFLQKYYPITASTL